MAWLGRVEFESRDATPSGWPWTIPALAGHQQFEFDTPVTLFVGENGTGKSTVLEAIAVACGCPEEGGASNRWMKGPRSGDSLAPRTRVQLESIPWNATPE